MKEDLITFETAKLAKEKSYKGGSNCLFILHNSTYEYDGDPNHLESYEEGDLTTDSKFYMVNGEPNLGDLSNEYYTLYERPSQSLLQKWLREVHGIEVIPSPYSKRKSYGCEVYHYTEKNENGYVPIELGSFKTYEEALEEGLQEGLKLI